MTDPHKPFRELIDGAKSALNELQRINITVDGMPFVSHGLCYNLTNKIAAAEAALPALAGGEKQLKAKVYLDNIDRMETNDPFNQ